MYWKTVARANRMYVNDIKRYYCGSRSSPTHAHFRRCRRRRRGDRSNTTMQLGCDSSWGKLHVLSDVCWSAFVADLPLPDLCHAPAPKQRGHCRVNGTESCLTCMNRHCFASLRHLMSCHFWMYPLPGSSAHLKCASTHLDCSLAHLDCSLVHLDCSPSHQVDYLSAYFDCESADFDCESAHSDCLSCSFSAVVSSLF